MGMKHRDRLAMAAALALGLAACGGGAEDAEATTEATDQPAEQGAASAGEAPADRAASAAEAGVPASADAPAFAVIYPGGALAETDADAPVATGVSYTVAATPDQVLDFYQAEAAKAGLSPVMALRQGERGGFGAMSATTGESLDVWAEAVGAEQTRVTLSWHAGGD